MFGDQFYWASRVQALGIGTSLVGVGSLTEKMVASALREVLEPDVAWRAQSIVANLRHDGALVAARRLVAL
jgi:vancomycin aglycone glucosyltransferase